MPVVIFAEATAAGLVAGAPVFVAGANGALTAAVVAVGMDGGASSM